MGHGYLPVGEALPSPLWQWKSACKNAGQPGKLVRCLAVLLSELFSRQFPQMSPFSAWSSWTGATDASAEPFGATWIGGWLSDLSTPTKDQVYWFQYQVTQVSHPWPFKRGDPQKRIAALELYGTLFLVLLLMEKQPTAACRLHIPLISDNQENLLHLEQCYSKNAKCSYLDGVGLPDLPSWAYACSNAFQER